MSLDVQAALREGFDRLFARNGLVLLAVFVSFGILNAILQQSLNRAQIDRFLVAADLEPVFRDLPMSASEFVDLLEQSTPLAFVDSTPLLALLGLFVLFAIVAETIRIVAVRTFVSEETERITREARTRRIGWAVAHGIVAGIVANLLIFLGFLLFVVPGIFLAISFLFVRQEVAIEDASPMAAIKGSWELAVGNRVSLFALFLALLVVWMGISSLVGIIVPEPRVLAAVVGVIGDAVVLAFSVATISRAYAQLSEARTEPEDELADVDPELLP